MNPNPRPPRNGWSTFGTVIAVVAAVCGLMVLGFVIIVFAAMSNFGSNK